MIEAKKLSKKFHKTKALNDVNLAIQDGEIFGLIGMNGAGKSTLLRLFAGVYRPDEGSALIDSKPVFDNPHVKSELFFVPDEPFYFQDATPLDMAAYYKAFYPTFDMFEFERLLNSFSLSGEDKCATFSKGMKRQMFISLGIAAHTRYLLLDESFDGLDPVARQAVKTLFASELADRGLTVLIASHALRELEDICDHVGLLHKGGVLLSKDVEDMKLSLQKVQVVFANDNDLSAVLSDAQVLIHEHRGRLHTITLRGTAEEVDARFKRADTVFFERLGLSLEEVFISETEAVGYDIKKLILG